MAGVPVVRRQSHHHDISNQSSSASPSVDRRGMQSPKPRNKSGKHTGGAAVPDAYTVHPVRFPRIAVVKIEVRPTGEVLWRAVSAGQSLERSGFELARSLLDWLLRSSSRLATNTSPKAGTPPSNSPPLVPRGATCGNLISRSGMRGDGLRIGTRTRCQAKLSEYICLRFC